MSDSKEGKKTERQNEEEEDYNDKKIASPSEEPVVEGNTKTAVTQNKAFKPQC